MPSPSRHSPSAPNSDRHHRSRHGHSHSHRHRHRDESRSRSPRRSDRPRSDRHHRRHDRHRDRHEHRSKEKEASARPVILPLGARELSRRDLETYEPMFAMYLDIQKGKFIEDLSEEELKGRWKSFVQKWYARFTPLMGFVLIVIAQEPWRTRRRLV